MSTVTQKTLLLHINETKDIDDEDASRIKELKKKIFALLHNPASSRQALWTNLFLSFVIVLSSAAFMVSSLPYFWERHNDTLLYFVEIFTIAIFTLEYITSVLSAPCWYKWMLEPLSIVDLIAIFPFYLELGIPSMRIRSFAVLRVVRLVRIFWLVKFAEFSASLVTIGETFRRSGEAMIMLAFLLSITTMIYSSAIFFAEQTVSTFDVERLVWKYHNGKETPFQSIFQCMWWCIITLTTVGYGDAVPESPLGKAIASCAAITGAIVLAFPVTILGSNIVAVRDEYKQKQAADKWENKLSMADRVGMTELSVLASIQEEYSKLCADISTIEGTLKSMSERKDKLGILLEFLKESCVGKVAALPASPQSDDILGSS